MKMKVIPIMLSVVLVLSSGGASLPVQAQDNDPDQHPLVRMLSAVPAELAIIPDSPTYYVSYTDIRAAERARPGVSTPASYAELEAMDHETSRLWFAATERLVSFAPFLFNIILFDADTVNYLGLDVFEIDQRLEFEGTMRGAVYGGHFDIDLIRNTLTRRTYTVTETNGIPVLCGPAGCESGTTFNNWLPDTGDRHDIGTYPIFGSKWGQQEPIGLLPGMLLSTAPWDDMTAMTAAAAGEADSLYDQPEFRAIADFAVDTVQAASDRLLIQVIFLQPSYFNPDLLSMAAHNRPENLTWTDIEEAFERMGIDESGKPLEAGDLPVYTRGAIVDWQSGSDQMHSIVLVYDNEADALAAAAEVLGRIPRQTAYIQQLREDPIISMATPEYMLEPPQAVYNPAADRWLAVATVRIPIPSNELEDPEIPWSTPRSGALVYYWFDSILYGLFMPIMLPSPPL